MPADEIFTLAREFGDASAAVGVGLHGAFKTSGEAYAQDWASNARETAGSHGRYYPDAIDSEMLLAGLGLTLEVGPNKAKKQGGMGPGFELGSQNQPPHLDGTRALPIMDQRLERAADLAVAYAVP
jgi:hypothetical protein